MPAAAPLCPRCGYRDAGRNGSWCGPCNGETADLERPVTSIDLARARRMRYYETTGRDARRATAAAKRGARERTA